MYAGGWVVPKNPVGTGRCTGCERIDRPNHAFGLSGGNQKGDADSVKMMI